MSMNNDFWEAIVMKWCVYPDKDLQNRIKGVIYGQDEREAGYAMTYSRNPLDDILEDDDEDDDEF